MNVLRVVAINAKYERLGFEVDVYTPFKISHSGVMVNDSRHFFL